MGQKLIYGRVYDMFQVFWVNIIGVKKYKVFVRLNYQ